MDAKGRGAIKTIAIAYGAAAALVFLQTLVLLAISYDSSAFGPITSIFRIAFFATDVAVLVGLTRLGRDHAPVKPFALGGVAIAIYSVVSGAFGLLSHGLGTPSRSEQIFQNFVHTMSAAEPAVSIGTTTLAVFAFHAIARAKEASSAKPPPRAMTVGWYAFFVVTASWIFITLVRASTREAQTMALAWTVWLFEIGKPLAVATCAYGVHRALEGAPLAEDAAKVGPYREGEAAAPPSGEAELPPPDPATIEPMRRAASGVSLYSTAFMIRIGVSFVLTILSIGAMNSGDLWIVFAFLPAVGAGTAAAMFVALGRQRELPSFRAGARLSLARAALAVSGAFDAFFTFGIFLAGASSSGWSATRKAETMWAMAYPTSAFFFGISILLVASALARTGDALARPALTRRARWAQSLAVAIFAFLFGLMFAIGAINHDYDQKNGGALVCGALSLAAFGATLAFVVMHVLTQAEAARTLRARLVQAP